MCGNHFYSLKKINMKFDYPHHKGSLYLRDCDLSGVTLPSSIGGWLDLTRSIALLGAVYGCGRHNRTICVYGHPTKGVVISLGCFVGTKQECIGAIQSKYSGSEAANYLAKVEQAFQNYSN